MGLDKDKDTLKEIGAFLKDASPLTHAAPFMQHYYNKVVVVKFGGAAMVDDTLAAAFAKDMVLLKRSGVHPIIVHGGGPQIGNFLKKLDIGTEFIDGLRVTDKDTVEVVEMVLSGRINKGIVAAIQSAGGYAIGLSGKDCRLMEAKKISHKGVDGADIDLGFVGEPFKIDPYFIREVIYPTDIIPVISPLGFGAKGETYNINADTAAGFLASALQAERLILLTDVAGVLDADDNLISELSLSQCQDLRKGGILKGGMIPKIETCVKAINEGVEAAVIIDGRTPHAILQEIFTKKGHGTLIKN